ncbi:threonine--tRNA ligase [Candidatus Nomurabacteria bacterium RIFCSPHIGHO2_02_FULL_33_12]|uniref:Threonine--tRNA ligase n=1 Tax=Candidatus Nomurabacteria bacterium RIFCSPLOWO2_01_FULL_33_17 TaxID=1801764 RepID=A0A1F6WN36_9BACT|nr:MAG: threonine--tRNA ligase [Candidatus Nomurabacteria bacterium RIFCSPHIGHO2_02_FULL_33_12]OGI83290.1 MAG: threonine--tRNA ligase [Candidatus Nomurabacteria bacterium RIFCSPLOWO2_01_FULL_33_17]
MNENNLSHIRHSLAHLLGAAILELYPESFLTLGPAIDNGFYYGAEIRDKVSEDDLEKIENKMRELAKNWTVFEKEIVDKDKAREIFKNNVYKNEIIDGIVKEDQEISLYTSGSFTDLCRGGHVENFKDIDMSGWKLDRIAGAYWRGDEKNKMLTRIYGLAFESKANLENYLDMREEAEKRDHKKLGKQLDLFTFSDLIGAGLPLFTPKGTLIRNLLDEYVWELRKKVGYEQVDIPHITKKDLYEKSGHWSKFKDDLFRIVSREGHEFAMKPMNCPHHTQIYARKSWSYKELPQRYASTTKVYRDEQSGELSGLSRVRSITQDDAHVFCRMQDAKVEMEKIYNIVKTFYQTFGFTLTPRLSLHDPNNMNAYLGSSEIWEKAENELRNLIKEKADTAIEAIGEAAFYGPKIDFMAKDAIGREWQVATIQLDMNMPESFDLSCTNENGEKERIIMIHAAIMGSLERFISTLIEHVAGIFPVWLSPVQVTIVPVRIEQHGEYANKILAQLREKNIRVEISNNDDSLGKRINSAKAHKVPYVIVIGDKEMESGNLTIETRTEKIEGIIIDDFIKKLENEIKNRTLG